ncbi:hypothetical protein Ddc_12971 [Ditylenchus destructor]|nr:hypothetical protein Ddc_12971 [Ditylenchus destructor]
MVNRNNARRRAKRRRDQASVAVQNQWMPRKMVIILDDSWLEALKHLTCRQWSKMSLVCRQVNGIVQRNISRLPRQVIESIEIYSQYSSSRPNFIIADFLRQRFYPYTYDKFRLHSTSSLQKLFHPASYIKKVAMYTVKHKLIDTFKSEKRYIRCKKFVLLPYSDKSIPPPVGRGVELKKYRAISGLAGPKCSLDFNFFSEIDVQRNRQYCQNPCHADQFCLWCRAKMQSSGISILF